jgi:hypothetical protein
MCKLTTPYTKSDTFTGYKLVLKINNKLYSPATGIEYKIGKVPKPRKAIEETKDPYFADVLDKNDCCYIAKYKGFTSLFCNEMDCHTFTNAMKGRNKASEYFTIVKMTITNTLFNGNYDNTINNTQIIAGKEILAIEELT